MIREALEDESCICGRPLRRAVDAQREDVRFRGGEFGGWEGVAIVARCTCGMTSVIALSADAPRAA